MKKSSITKKLTLTNVLIVILSLLIFFTIVILIVNNNSINDIKNQLLIENKVASTLYYNNRIQQPALFRILTDSINLIYTKTDDGLELYYSSDESFDETYDPEPIIISYINAKKKVLRIRTNGGEYLCAISTNTQYEEEADSAVISLISMSSIRQITRGFTFALIISIVSLSLISVIVTIFISKRISRPVIKLTEIAKQYEQRNFDTSYIADTDDEIEDLSIAVSNMANSIKQHDAEKDKLFRQISHEIKTPLTSIYGYAEGIKSGVFTDLDKPLDVIMSESLRIKKLTENIVLLSKIESNIEMFHFDKKDVSPILEHAIESIESIAILGDIDLDYTPSKLPKVSVDEDKLFRAFVNILSNCIKYAKSNIIITSAEKDGSIEISISDDGNGFENEAVENIISGTAREKNSGSGIGLSIVNEIVKAHGGSFYMGNKPDGGAYFKIALKKLNIQGDDANEY